MKVVVFGATGFVGRNMVEALSKTNIDFIASDVTETKFSKDVNYIKADLLKPNEVENVVKDLDVIIHLAASGLPFSLKNPKLNMDINIGGTLNILDAARKHGVKKVIFSSASSIVGNVTYNPVDEKHPCVPKTPYAVAKYAIENYLRVYQEIYGLNYLIFRFFNVYGPKQYIESGALIPNVLKKIINGEEVTLTGDGSSTRDFIYVGDVVDALIKAANEEKIKNEIVNLGTGVETSIKEIVTICGKVTGIEPKIKYVPSRPGEISNFRADMSKFKKIFGYVPKIGAEEGIIKTYEWFKKEYV